MRRTSATGSSVSAAAAGSGAGASAPHFASMLQPSSALGRACVSAPVAMSLRCHVTRRCQLTPRSLLLPRCSAHAPVCRALQLSAVAYGAERRRPQQARGASPPQPQRARRCSVLGSGVAARPLPLSPRPGRRAPAHPSAAPPRGVDVQAGPASGPAPRRQTRPQLPASSCGKPGPHLPTHGQLPGGRMRPGLPRHTLHPKRMWLAPRSARAAALLRPALPAAAGVPPWRRGAS